MSLGTVIFTLAERFRQSPASRHRLWTAFFLLKLTTFVPLIMLLQPDHIGLAMEALRLGARLSPASRPS
jgi:hypothetical protein